MVSCWECETVTNRPRAAMLPTASDSGRRVRLCPSCYQDQCLRLISDIAGRFVAGTLVLGNGPGRAAYVSGQS
jgi:hypothetical protein